MSEFLIRSKRQIAIMAGTSAGTSLHAADIPFDHARFLIDFHTVCKRHDAQGIFIANARPGYATDASIRQRIELQKKLVEQLAPNTIFLCPQKLSQAGFDVVESDILPIEKRELDRDEYTRWQVAQVLWIRKKLAENCDFKKFGWMQRRNGDEPKGGEVLFDECIPDDSDMEFIYGPPGYSIGGTAKAPYLVQEGEQEARLLIKESQPEVETELDKLSAGVSARTLLYLEQTAKKVLGENGSLHVLFRAVRKPDKIITDHNEILLLQQILFRTYEKLLDTRFTPSRFTEQEQKMGYT